MKLIHLSDLHLGKRIGNFSMLEDQQYILRKITGIIDEEKPDGIIIAGDVYDKSIPSAEAVTLFDDFLTWMLERRRNVFVISGNHDSAERLAFGGRIMDAAGIHFAPVYDGTAASFTLIDGNTEADIYLLPFVKPGNVNSRVEDADVSTYTEAMETVVKNMNINTGRINILVAHQFVTGAERSESETSVGGLDNVDSGVFDMFDYVALGHIHGPQSIGRETVRYCGTPLKYSFSEEKHEKSVTVIEIEDKENIRVRTVPLSAKHDMRTIEGLFDEIMLRSNYEGTATEDFIRVILHDEDDIPNAMDRLRVIYPNVMELRYDNTRTRNLGYADQADAVRKKSGIELLDEFYEKMNGSGLSDEQRKFSEKLFDELKEADE